MGPYGFRLPLYCMTPESLTPVIPRFISAPHAGFLIVTSTFQRKPCVCLDGPRFTIELRVVQVRRGLLEEVGRYSTATHDKSDGVTE